MYNIQNHNDDDPMQIIEKQTKAILFKDYSNLLNGGAFKDFSIFVGEKESKFEFQVHKSILSSRSPFFSAYLKTQKQIQEIFLNQFNKKEMDSILRYIYFGDVTFSEQENLFELLEISTLFQLSFLKNIFENTISNSINQENYFEYFFHNRKLKLVDIEQKCLYLMDQNFAKIKGNPDFLKLTKDEILKLINLRKQNRQTFNLDFFDFLNKWIENQTDSLKGEKTNIKINKRKGLFHSFFSCFTKNDILKPDLEKFKDVDFFPKSFLLHLQEPRFEIEKKEKQTLKNQVNQRETEIQKKEKEIKDLKSEIEQKEHDNQDLRTENKKMKPVFDDYQKELESAKNLYPQYSDSEIIKDLNHIKRLRKWINNDEFFSKMKRGFSAKRDGFSCTNWHSAVDNKGKTLVIIKTKDNFIFGGFTEVGFTNNRSKWLADYGNEGYIIDPNAFIFSLRNDKNNRPPEKFPIKQGNQTTAIYYVANDGPTFGGGADIYLNSYLQPGGSNFGHTYSTPNGIEFGTNEAKNYLAGSLNQWQVEELETYFL
ncbi:pep-cterm sorting domain-containing protein [Anaeramoeba ignava]|uniref:Pep-cterm sorting domain-containing protein n=1 Tax=Anaeramoeba ignava TaxID=1746090 RepID=A0A9Q0R694_ANAIG|nr:pep-cterm sorting domain-containing protein [Anaeramoeba ignava]